MRLTRKTLSCAIAVLAAGGVALSAACGGSSKTSTPTGGATGASSPSSASGSTIIAGTSVPGARGSVTLRGAVTLDGAPVEAQFVGARLIRGGLAAQCQDEIPQAVRGQYQLTVAADAAVRGCGVDGARVLLWIYTDRFLYSTDSIAWPGDGAAATFDAHFSSATPDGASEPVSGFKGRLLARDGSQLQGGTVVEASIGNVLCGITSLRYGDVTQGIYSLAVAGPHAVPGCAEGGTITFRVNGAAAVETAVNDFGRGRDPGSVLDLHIR